MTEAEKNKEKRKHQSLTNQEFLTFFFFPFNRKRGLLHNHEFNKTEDERFLKYGFEKKLKDAQKARLYGKIFYFGMAVLLSIILRNI